MASRVVLISKFWKTILEPCYICSFSIKNCICKISWKKIKVYRLHMNSENLRLFICYCTYNYSSRDEHGPIRTVPTDATFVQKKKFRYYTQILLTHSQPKNKNCIKMSTQSQVLYKPKNHQTNVTTFNANRSITVT